VRISIGVQTSVNKGCMDITSDQLKDLNEIKRISIIMIKPDKGESALLFNCNSL